jgi:ppGpp synthetase/RelA/SpoT-type nucleotidyltranferase
MGKFTYSGWRIKHISVSLPRAELQQAGMMPVEVEIRTAPLRN